MNGKYIRYIKDKKFYKKMPLSITMITIITIITQEENLDIHIVNYSLNLTSKILFLFILC